MYDAVIFDVDGTLFNTSEGIFNCINYVLIEEHLPALEKQILKSFIGPPVYDSFIKYCNVDSSTAARLTQKYREYYVKKFVRQSVLYDNMDILLQSLKKAHIKIAIATMKTQPQIDALLINKGYTDYFNIVLGVSERICSKTEMIVNIAQSLNISDLNEILMVGDTYSDAVSAQKAGSDFAGVSYGFGLNSVSDLEGLPYDKVFSTVNELQKYILKK